LGAFFVFQYVEYFIDRGVLGVTREVQHPVLEYRGEPVKPGTHAKWDSGQSLVVPTMPPSMVGVCRLLQLYYVLKVSNALLMFAQPSKRRSPFYFAPRSPLSQPQKMNLTSTSFL